MDRSNARKPLSIIINQDLSCSYYHQATYKNADQPINTRINDLGTKKLSTNCVESDRNDEKPALLFLHGILGDGRTWLPLLDQFPEYDTYALTQSGFHTAISMPTKSASTIAEQESADQRLNINHESDTKDEEILFDTDRHADELIAFCQALNQKEGKLGRQFVLIAWSYACHIALLALQKSQRNSQMVDFSHQSNPRLFHSAICYELIVPSYGMSFDDQALFTRDITKMMSPIIKAYRRNQPINAINAFINACKNSQNEYTIDDQSPYIQAIKQDNAHSLPKLLSQIEPKEISDIELVAIHSNTPITILCGENSRGIFQLASKSGANALNQEKWHIPGADHLLPENDPLLFAENIKAILGLQ